MLDSLSIGVFIGQAFILVLMLALLVVVIRFLLAATRLMSRKAEQLEQERSTEQSDSPRGG